MYYVGIDIGSTATKLWIFKNDIAFHKGVYPTGWSSVKVAEEIKDELNKMGITKENSRIVATGYGRVSVPYADKTITEITCHGKGAHYLFENDCTVIDIGGQDTKVITVTKGRVSDFSMNDKCAAGTGRFLELMANTLGIDIDELCQRAEKGSGVSISSMCTVFAESEVISMIGSGKSREDIAFGVVESITSKVKSLCQKHSGSPTNYFLTGGLSSSKYIVKKLEEKLGVPVLTSDVAIYAGAIGAALFAKELQ